MSIFAQQRLVNAGSGYPLHVTGHRDRLSVGTATG